MRPHDTVLDTTAALARELSDPVRLAALQLLATEGPHTQAQLADAVGVSTPRMGNHLARLRDAGLVAVTHEGRHARYRVARADLGAVLTTLTHFAHGDAPSFARSPSRADLAHTCYDHVAGRLGVTVFATLVDRAALSTVDDQVAIGPNELAFWDLGVDPATVDAGRRKLVTACLDRSHRLPHLGGALGAALLSALEREKLVQRVPDSRDLVITTAGRKKLPALLPGWH
ncbi:winged helix-turn-helix domain-containing protein [Actinophytocola sp.]|uniref:ArsR/SmtB family transcription factor n=1 Tax=Actinophytocola sp. TaxID=1872138 RepID=UPI002ED0186C